jgi:hypothetical protein
MAQAAKKSESGPVSRPMNGDEYRESLRDGREIWIYVVWGYLGLQGTRLYPLCTRQSDIASSCCCRLTRVPLSAAT